MCKIFLFSILNLIILSVKRLKNDDPVMDIEDLVINGTKQRSAF